MAITPLVIAKTKSAIAIAYLQFTVSKPELLLYEVFDCFYKAIGLILFTTILIEDLVVPVKAHIRAPNQPIIVQPRKKLSKEIATTFGRLRTVAIIGGRKYNKRIINNHSPPPGIGIKRVHIGIGV